METTSLIPEIVLVVRVDSCLRNLYAELTGKFAQVGTRDVFWDPVQAKHQNLMISDLPVLEYLFHVCGGGVSSVASDRDRFVKMPSEDMTEYNPIPLVEIKDSYDESTFDNMCGVVEMRFLLPDTRAFPSTWKIHRSHTKIYVEYVPLDHQSREQREITHGNLFDWIDYICKYEGKV